MNVSAALDWLFSTQFFGIKLGLDNTRKLLAAAGADRINATVVHVAGTNGKGSTCAMIEALARAQGYVTGLFTSPHLVDFSERIRVNGNMITPDALAEEISFLKQLAEGWEQPPTFFELALAVALRHFRKNSVNFIILEGWTPLTPCPRISPYWPPSAWTTSSIWEIPWKRSLRKKRPSSPPENRP